MLILNAITEMIAQNTVNVIIELQQIEEIKSWLQKKNNKNFLQGTYVFPSSSFFRWLPHCASLFDNFDNLWLPLLRSEQGSPELVQEFFNSVAVLMSLQLRSLVIDSLQDLLYFFTIHEV